MASAFSRRSQIKSIWSWWDIGNIAIDAVLILLNIWFIWDGIATGDHPGLILVWVAFLAVWTFLFARDYRTGSQRAAARGVVKFIESLSITAHASIDPKTNPKETAS